MPDMYLDVDAALAEVPVNLMPLIDDTDFKTVEDALAYDASGMDLRWNFVTSAGAYTSTAVTPTTSGNYDWAHQGDGMYSIEIPASGGASINNDTEGYGWFTGKITGVLPFRGPVIGFRAAGLNDLLCDSAYSTTRGLSGTALPNAAADAAGGLAISDAGGLDLDAKLAVATSALATPTNITAGTITTATNVTTVNGLAAGVITAASIATGAIDADALAADAGTELGTAVWASATRTLTSLAGLTVDTVTTLTNLPAITANWLTAAGTAADFGTEVGAAVWATTTRVLTAGTNVDGSTFTAIPWNAAWDAEVQSEVDDALVAKGLDHLVFTSVTGTDIADNSIIAKLASKSATADWDSFDNTTDALEANRDNIGTNGASLTVAATLGTGAISASSFAAGAIDAAAIAADAGTEIGTAVWSTATRTLTAGTNIQLPSNALDLVLIESSISAGASLTNDAGTQLTSVNLRQGIALCTSVLAGVLSGAATTTNTIKAGGNASSNSRVVATCDSSGNRTALTIKVPT